MRRLLASVSAIALGLTPAFAQQTPGQNQQQINGINWLGSKTVTGAQLQSLFTNINGTYGLYGSLSGPNIWTNTNTFTGANIHGPQGSETFLGPVTLPTGNPVSASNAGIVCPGNTVDVTATLQTWITANAGHTEILPSGVCGLSAGLSVPANTELVGQGQGVTTLDASVLGRSGMGAIVYLNANYASVASLTTKGVGALGTRYDDGVRIGNGSLHNTVQGVEVTASGDNGIETGGSYSNIVLNYVHGNYTNGIYGYALNSSPSKYVSVTNNQVENNSLGSPTGWDGIDFDPYVQHSLIKGNTVVGNDIIVFSSNVAGTADTFDVSIEDNKVISPVAGCLTASGPVSQITFKINSCWNAGTSGIKVNGPVRNVTYKSNEIWGSANEGAIISKLTGGANAGIPDSVILDGNTYSNTVSAGGSSAVLVKDAATNITITHEKFLGTVGQYSIDTSAAATSVTIGANVPLVYGSSGYINNLGGQNIESQPLDVTGLGSMIGGEVSPNAFASQITNSIIWGQGAVGNSNNCFAFGYLANCNNSFSVVMGANSFAWQRWGFETFANGDLNTNGDAQSGRTTLRNSGTCAGGTVTVRVNSRGTIPTTDDLVNINATGHKQAINLMLILSDENSDDYVVYTLTGLGVQKTSGGTYQFGSNQPSFVKGGGSTTGLSWAAPTIAADAGNNGINLSWTNASCTNGHVYSGVAGIQALDH